MFDSKVLPETRDKRAAYHRTAIDALFQIAETQKRVRAVSRRLLARAALEFLETQGDSMVTVVRHDRKRDNASTI